MGLIVKEASIKRNENVEEYVGIGSTVHTKKFFRRRRDLEVTVTGILKQTYDGTNLDSAFLSLWLGDAPVAAGTIALRPNTTNNNLRSATIEIGYISPAGNRFYRIRGCMGKNLTLRTVNDYIEFAGTLVAQDTTIGTAAAAALPAEPTVKPFNPNQDSTWSFTTPTVTGLDLVEWAWKVENVLLVKGTQIQAAGRTIGEPQIAGRKTMLDLTLWRSGHNFEDQLANNDPAADVGAQQDVSWTLSKNSGAQFLHLTWTKARVVNAFQLELSDDDATIIDKWSLAPETYAVDVVTP